MRYELLASGGWNIGAADSLVRMVWHCWLCCMCI